MKDIDKWRGLKSLVQDAVEHGTSAIEQVHLATARRTFDALKLVPPIAQPVAEVQQVYDTVVSSAYASVRAVNKLAGQSLDVVLDALEGQGARAAQSSSPAAESRDEPAGE